MSSTHTPNRKEQPSDILRDGFLRIPLSLFQARYYNLSGSDRLLYGELLREGEILVHTKTITSGIITLYSSVSKLSARTSLKRKAIINSIANLRNHHLIETINPHKSNYQIQIYGIGQATPYTVDTLSHKENEFIIVPVVFLEDMKYEGMRPNHMLLWGLLYRETFKKVISVDYTAMAKMLGVTPKSVSTYIRHLEALELITHNEDAPNHFISILKTTYIEKTGSEKQIDTEKTGPDSEKMGPNSEKTGLDSEKTGLDSQKKQDSYLNYSSYLEGEISSDILARTKKQIDYNRLIIDRPEQKSVIQEVLSCMVRVYTCTDASFRLNQNTVVPLGDIERGFLSLQHNDIANILNRGIDRHKNNPRNYICTALWNESLAKKHRKTYSANKFNSYEGRSYDMRVLEQLLVQR